ncbi:ammonia-forming cytochrome c nitrite reductase subunit c552 [Desulfuribacillus alkaliarsenatis]|uniref:Uncharacterized protein n=1 Tax=Desulfuribacillus alkaliarsenatis TaxID=766136 RepID=A0A1E5FZ45_9FIRM|nr:ammonia-forming cytochrome c nitrite reductase subunit c552 [Desulfuribacillus alkaliarsenatis]OEF95843.1 hypothetical protein BHF68_10630 [Desulfuribacillus alkaliarsenatis]
MKKALVLMLVFIAAMFVFTGCEDAIDAPVVPAGPSDLAIAEKITEEWATTGKVFATYSIVERHYGETTNANSCLHCHDGATFAAGISGELAGSHFTGMDCAACHSGVGANFIETGLVDASLPYFNNTYITESFETDSSALCIACHNGRRNPSAKLANYIEGEAGFMYNHYGPAALVSGQGGMQFPDVDYATSPVHTDMSCVGCHMPETGDGYKSHTFKATVEGCQDCHSSATDFNFRGFQDKVKDNLKVVYDAAFEASGAAEVRFGGGAGITFVDASGETIAPNKENIAPEVFAAMYNYYMIYRDGSYGVHNPVYTKSLLNVPYEKITGQTLEW